MLAWIYFIMSFLMVDTDVPNKPFLSIPHVLGEGHRPKINWNAS